MQREGAGCYRHAAARDPEEQARLLPLQAHVSHVSFKGRRLYTDVTAQNADLLQRVPRRILT